MKIGKFLTGVCLIAFSASPAFANHEGGGSLQGAAAELNEQVQCSSLRYQVKYAVNFFAQQAARYSAYCGETMGMTQPMNHEGEGIIQPLDHNGGGANCRYELRNVLRSWSLVERYLYDTNYDYPNIYNSYLETRAAVQEAARGFGRFNEEQ